jgi:hypothetical protein
MRTLVNPYRQFRSINTGIVVTPGSWAQNPEKIEVAAATSAGALLQLVDTSPSKVVIAA